jgi:hypothetical protein
LFLISPRAHMVSGTFLPILGMFLLDHTWYQCRNVPTSVPCACGPTLAIFGPHGPNSSGQRKSGIGSVAATEAGIVLHGLAIEVYGRWGDDFSSMFNHFISLGAANSNIPRAILANYWRRRISVCLQSGVANAINTRSNRLTARYLGAGELHSSHGEAFFSWNNRRRSFRNGFPIGRDFDGG